eukprot:m.84071 g.84071  ORF g.84071 m.84071 type:complete len:311 (-) comp25705_c0_seq1:88-1020(-)
MESSTSRNEIPAVTCDVKYHGFVYVNGGTGFVPDLGKVKEAHKLLMRPKKAQKTHPLFARGFDTLLTLRCSEQGLKVFLRNESGQNMAVMDHAVYKIAFVCNLNKTVVFVAKRRIDSSVDQFKCHGFEVSSQKTAKQLATHLCNTCNSVFRKLRRTRKQIRTRKEQEGHAAPVTNTNIQPSKEEAERLKAELQAEVDAAKAYRQSLQMALSSLDEEDDDEEEASIVADMHDHMRIIYDEYSDDFAKISLEIAAQAEADRAQRKTSGQRDLLLALSGEGDSAFVEDTAMIKALGDINLDSDEYLISRSASI